MSAKSDQVKGHIKEAAGVLSGDKDIEAEGKTDRRTGEAEEKIDHAKDKIEEVIDVTKDKIESWLDGKQTADVETKDRTISVRPEVELSRPLGIACFATTAALREIKVRRLDEEEAAAR